MDKTRYIHFIGIGGAGMSGIAQILAELKYKVSGSDIKSNNNTKRLQKEGVLIFKGHKAENLEGYDIGAIVVSSAIPENNPEIIWARQKNIPIYRRAEVLGYILNNKYGIAISGTHGKTTTTSMISSLMESYNFNPTIIVGGEVCDFGGNAKLGGGTYTVVEADESDASFLHLCPQVIVITNIEEDHLDYYSGIKEIKNTFLKFTTKLKSGGTIVCCSDNDNIRELIPQIKNDNHQVITYGMEAKNNPDYLITEIRYNGMGVSFEIKNREKSLGRFRLTVPGVHNALNATASIIICHKLLNMPLDEIRDILPKFQGVIRRFQVIGEVNGIKVIDDYAHHPTEIKATLNAARSSFENRIIAIFQPHRFSRTKFFYEQMAEALKKADVVILTDIYAASEQPMSGVSSELILNSLKKAGKSNSFLINDIKNIPSYAASIAQKNDFIFTIGAGDVTSISTDIIKKLQEKYTASQQQSNNYKNA
ncbi:MAG: UDP-N-acetylmuramate--L-alanine ligase [Candidatus Wallbacteria bacterium]